jgi:hypothetical protein
MIWVVADFQLIAKFSSCAIIKGGDTYLESQPVPDEYNLHSEEDNPRSGSKLQSEYPRDKLSGNCAVEWQVPYRCLWASR